MPEETINKWTKNLEETLEILKCYQNKEDNLTKSDYNYIY